MANISKLRSLVAGIPTTIDLTAAGAVLQATDFQIVNAAVTASKPAKLDANKKITSGNIDLASEVTGTLPVGNGGTGSATRNFVDLTSSETVAGTKTFSSFPITPSAAPTTNYQVANKKYVDDTVSGGIVGAMIYKGTFDASAGNYTAIVGPKAGYFYKVSVSGLIGTRQYNAGDNMYINKDVAVNPVEADIDVVDNTEIVSSVNTQVGAVVLVTDDIAEDASPTNKWFTNGRAQTAAVVNTLVGSETAQAPSVSSVNSALGGKEATITGGTTSQYWRGDKSFQTLDTAAVAENASYKYFTDGRAQTAAVVNSTAGTETVQAASVSAMKAYAESHVFTRVAGESFAANSTFVVRMAVDGEVAGRVYKATSDEQNASGKYRVIGIIQTVGAVSAADTVTVIKFSKEITLKSADTVVGASAADQGKYIWLNKAGGFSLASNAGITATESYANVIIGEIVEYSATNTSEKIMIDCNFGNFTGIDLA